MKHASKLFGNDVDLFRCVRERVGRSIPQMELLRDPDNRGLVQLLRRVIEENGIEAINLKDCPGLNVAYKFGYLHAAFYGGGEGQTFYTLPTTLHRRWRKTSNLLLCR